jgi:uncharacterized protein YbjQ (UPF0145 family)
MRVYVELPEELKNKVEVGELLFASGVMAANAIKDFKESVRNIVGGPMRHYEDLVEKALERAIERLKEHAKEKGYDGLTGFRVAHPSLVDGGAEVVVFANGFRFKNGEVVK